jgi:hypothetical protein
LARLSDFLLEVNPRTAARLGELLEEPVLSLGQFPNVRLSTPTALAR